MASALKSLASRRMYAWSHVGLAPLSGAHVAMKRFCVLCELFNPNAQLLPKCSVKFFNCGLHRPD